MTPWCIFFDICVLISVEFRCFLEHFCLPGAPWGSLGAPLGAPGAPLGVPGRKSYENVVRSPWSGVAFGSHLRKSVVLE